MLYWWANACSPVKTMLLKCSLSVTVAKLSYKTKMKTALAPLAACVLIHQVVKKKKKK